LSGAAIFLLLEAIKAGRGIILRHSLAARLGGHRRARGRAESGLLGLEE
jgi:hypothetical protein